MSSATALLSASYNICHLPPYPYMQCHHLPSALICNIVVYPMLLYAILLYTSHPNSYIQYCYLSPCSYMQNSCLPHVNICIIIYPLLLLYAILLSSPISYVQYCHLPLALICNIDIYPILLYAILLPTLLHITYVPYVHM